MMYDDLSVSNLLIKISGHVRGDIILILVKTE